MTGHDDGGGTRWTYSAWLAQQGAQEGTTPEGGAPLDAIEATLDAWLHDLVQRAQALRERLEAHRRAHRASGRGTYRRLILSVGLRGCTLEIRWQRGDRVGPHGRKPKRGLWLRPIRKIAARDGNGYPYSVLEDAAHPDEVGLVAELEREARRLREEHADLMTVRRGVVTVRARERRREEREEDR